MAGKSMTDNFTFPAVFNVAEAVAGTLVFEKLETGLSVYDKIGWVIQRIEYNMGVASAVSFNTSGDFAFAALTITNSLTTLSPENPAILDMWACFRADYGTAASGRIMENRWIHDFTGLSGGGILTLPNPLYLGVVGSGLSTTLSVNARIYCKAVELSDADYFNLVQARQLLIST